MGSELNVRDKEVSTLFFYDDGYSFQSAAAGVSEADLLAFDAFSAVAEPFAERAEADVTELRALSASADAAIDRLAKYFNESPNKSDPVVHLRFLQVGGVGRGKEK